MSIKKFQLYNQNFLQNLNILNSKSSINKIKGCTHQHNDLCAVGNKIIFITYTYLLLQNYLNS